MITRELFEKQEEITYYINNDCINCGLCVKECPENCIDVYKKPAVIDQSKCQHCGSCAEVCPPGAIRDWDE